MKRRYLLAVGLALTSGSAYAQLPSNHCQADEDCLLINRAVPATDTSPEKTLLGCINKNVPLNPDREWKADTATGACMCDTKFQSCKLK